MAMNENDELLVCQKCGVSTITISEVASQAQCYNPLCKAWDFPITEAEYDELTYGGGEDG